MPHRKPSRRQLLAASVGALSAAGAGCIGTLEEATGGDGEAWMPREELEGGVWKEDEGWADEDQLLELINGKINQRRHDRGIGAVEFDIGMKNELRSEARMDVAEAPSGVEVVEDPFRCQNGRQIKVHVSVEYESKYDDEDGLLINANRDTIAGDAVERMAASDEMSEVLFDAGLESHAARVNIGDQGTVYVPNVFCGPES